MLYCYSMASGGHLYHARPIEVALGPERRGICGFEPCSFGRLHSGVRSTRGSWTRDYMGGDPSQGRPVSARICPRCFRLLRKLGVVDDA